MVSAQKHIDVLTKGVSTMPTSSLDLVGGKIQKNQSRDQATRKYEDECLNEFERSIYVVNITSKDFEDVIGSNWNTERVRAIDFSGNNYRLEVLGQADGPDSRRGILNKHFTRTSLTSLNVSNNRLHDVDIVTQANGFKSLMILMARRNLIFQFLPDLPALMELNLSRNRLTVLPKLDGCPNLEHLIVSHNHISGTFNNLLICKRLKRLDVSDNNFDFEPSELGKSLQCLTSTLMYLRLYDNPFVACFKEYQLFVIAILGSLMSLDNVKVGWDLRADVKSYKMMTLDCYDDTYRKRRRAFQAKHQAEKAEAEDAIVGFPRLERMLELLEEILEEPGKLTSNIKELIGRAKMLSSAKSTSGDGDGEKLNIEDDVWYGIEDRQNCDMVTSQFLEYFVCVMERHPSVRSVLTLTLGHLTCATKYRLGERCMDTLGKMMMNSESEKKEVKDALGQVVIPMLEQHENLNEQEHCRTIVHGLVMLLGVEAIHDDVAEAMQDLIPLMTRWIIKTDDIKNADLGVQLLSVLEIHSDPERGETNIRMEDMEELLTKVLSSIDSRSIAEHESLRALWLDLLLLAEKLVKHSKADVAAKMEKFGMHIKIISRAKIVEHGGEAQKNLKEARTLARCISFVAQLMERKQEVTRDCCNSYHFMELLCLLLKQPNIDPLVLSSSCWALRVALSDDQTFAAHIGFVVKELEKMTPLLAVLGGARYADLYRRSRWHTINKNEEQLSDKEKEEIDTDSRSPWNNNNLVANKAMLGIIELVDFFACEKVGEQESSRDQRAQVNDALDSSDREKILLKLLVLEDDDIKHAVIKCLGNVPVGQIQLEEMGLIIKKLNATQNIGEGRTEETLALIVEQLQRLVKDEKHTGRDFRKHFAPVAIPETYNILRRNMERPTYNGGEEDQKLRLSAAIVEFFTTCSRFPQLQDYFNNPSIAEIFPIILKKEEELVTPTKTDVNVEACYTGRVLENLCSCLHGDASLHRHKKVALRVLSRIADVLEGCTDSLGGTSYAFGDVVDKEKSMWDQVTIERNLKFLGNKEIDTRKKQVQEALNGSGLQGILQFVADPNFDDRVFEYREQLEVGMAYQKKLHDMAQVRKKDIEEKDKEQKAQEVGLTIDMNDAEGNTYDEWLGRDVMMKAIQQVKEITDTDTQGLFGAPHPTLQALNKPFIDEKLGLVGAAYGVAAVLRMLHALLVVPPSEECRDIVLKVIRDDQLIMEFLIFLQEHAFTEAHVGAKFLRVMSHAIEYGADSDPTKYFPLASLYMLSCYTRKIAEALAYSLRLSRDTPMSNSEQILCSEMARYMDTVLTVATMHEFSSNMDVQGQTLSECLDWLVPPVVTRLMVAVVTYDLQMDQGAGQGNDTIRATYVAEEYGKRGMKEYATSFLAKLCVRCPHHKYDVLEAFSASSIFLHMNMRSSYLFEFLQGIDLGKYMVYVERWLMNHQMGTKKDKMIHMAMVEVQGSLVSTKHLKGNMLCLLCVTAGKLYLVTPVQDKPPYADADLGARWDPSWESSFAREPTLLCVWKYEDLEAIYRGYGTQLMGLVFKESIDIAKDPFANAEGDGSTPLREDPAARTNKLPFKWPIHLLFSFSQSNHCEIVIQALYRMTGLGKPKRAPIIHDRITHDNVIRSAGEDGRRVVATIATEACENGSVLGASKLYVLTDKHLHEFTLNLGAWEVPKNEWDEDDFDDFDDFKPLVLGKNGKVAVLTEAQKKEEENIEERKKRKQVEEPPQVLINHKKQDLNLQEIGFETSSSAVLSIGLGATKKIRFFDDSGRETWRRALSYVLVCGNRTWERKHEAAKKH